MTVPASQNLGLIHVKLMEWNVAHKSSIIVHHYQYEDFSVILKISKKVPASLAFLISFSLRKWNPDWKRRSKILTICR